MTETVITEMLNMNDIISLKYIFGYNSDVKNNIILLTDNSYSSKKILFTSGNFLVIYNIATKEQYYINGSENSEKFSLIQMSYQKNYFAVCEEGQNAMISIYETKNIHNIDKPKRKKILYAPDYIKKIDKLSFSFKEENKYLMTISLLNLSQYKLIIWEWDKGKKREFDINGFDEINSFFYHPHEDHIFILGKTSTTSNSNISYKTYIYKNENLIPKQDIIKDNIKSNLSNFYITSHLICSDNSIIFGNNKGELIYMNNHYELKSKLPSSPCDNHKIEIIIPANSGFLAASDNGIIHIFERKEKDVKYPYEKSEKRIFSKEDIGYSINSMILLNDNLIVGYKNGSLLNFNFFMHKLNDETIKYDNLVKPFHLKEITCIDYCDRKSLFVTGSKDKYIKIWNYNDFTLEISKKFESEINSVAFHPNGFNLAIAFKDRIKLLNILIDEIKVYKEFIIKNCTTLKFSNGGHYLAVASSSTIYIYSFYLGEQIGQYNFKEHESIIKEFIWDDTDFLFLSAGSDGKIFQAELDKNIIHKSYLDVKNESITAFDTIINDKGERNIISNSENESYIYHIVNKLKENKDKNNILNDNKKDFNYEIKKIDTGVSIIDIKFAKYTKQLFMSTDDNYLRCYKYPFTNEMSQIKCHLGKIKIIKIMKDDSLMFTIGDCNTLCVWEIKKGIKRDIQSYAEEYLYDNDLYTKKKTELIYLEREIKKKEKENKNIDEKNKFEKENIKNDLENKRDKNDIYYKKEKEKISKEIIEMDKFYIQKIENMNEQHFDKKILIQEENYSRIRYESNKYNELKKEKELLEKKFKSDNLKIKKNHKELQEKLDIEYKNKIESEKKIIKELELKKDLLMNKYENEIEVLELDTDKKIEYLKDDYEIKLDKLKIKKSEMNTTLEQEKKKWEEIEQKKRKTENDLANTNTNINSMTEEISTANKERINNESEINEREKTIEKKIERINDLKRKKQELEKFKFVLDYKIKELKNEKGPREEEIAKMKDQLTSMKLEIENFKKTNSYLRLCVSELNLKLEGMNNEIKNQEYTINNQDCYLNTFENDFSDVVSLIENYKILKVKLVELYNKYVQNNDKIGNKNTDQQKIAIEQREYLEKCVSTLKDKFDNNLKVNKQDNKRIMKEKVDLIGAINELKRDKHEKNMVNKKNEKRKNEIKKHLELDKKFSKNKKIILELKNELETKKDKIN